MPANTEHASEAKSMTIPREADPGRALREQEVAERLSLSIATLRAWRRRGQGPRFVRFGRFATWSEMWNNSFGRARSTPRTPTSTQHRRVPHERPKARPMVLGRLHR